MIQSLSQVIIHIIFSTKNRQKFLSKEIQKEVHAYLATIIRNMGAEAFRVGGTADHIHITCSLPRTISQSDFLKKIKHDSSHWLKTDKLKDFSWQRGYGVFSVSKSQLENLLSYIDNQEKHHEKVSFKEELIMFLQKYNIAYDESYLWE